MSHWIDDARRHASMRVRIADSIRSQSTSLRKQRGLTLIEVLFAVALGSLLLVSVLSLAEQGTREMREAAAGAQLKELGHAVESYVMNHYAALAASATATQAVAVPLESLISGGYLPSGYTGVNPYADRYTLYVLEPKSGDLAALILGSGGFSWRNDPADNHYADVVIPGAAQAGGPEAGYVATGDVPGEVHDSLVGAYGGWSFSIAQTSIPNPGPGHLVLFEYFSMGTFRSDALYRVAVPGHPELNEMSTRLDMGNHSVNDVHNLEANGTLATSGLSATRDFPRGVMPNGVHTWNLFANNGIYAGVDASGNPEVAIRGGTITTEGDVTAEHGQVSLAHTVVYETLAQNGSVIPKPSYCPSGSGAQIFVTPVFISGGPAAYPIGGYQAWASGTSQEWTIHARVLTQAGWEYPPAPYLVVKAAVKCG
ncbi:MAG: shufflon system plasmid conjugative transfer pilus tip adhesin PilV [Gammaproteobacteria bacterium]